MRGTTGVRVLFAGEYWPGANSVYLARAFERCGVVLRWLNDTALSPKWISVRGRAVRRLLHRLVIEPEWNHQLLELVSSFGPDLVYITNAHYCWPQTLLAIKSQSIPIMCFYHDPPWQDRPQSRFAANISYFDLIATTRRWHKPEFEAAGAGSVLVVRFGFEPSVHRPVSVAQKGLEHYQADVAFVGSYRWRRQVDFEALLNGKFPYTLRIWGGGWNRLPRGSSVGPHWQGRDVHEQEIPVIYAASKVALHWVNWEPDSHDPAIRKGDQHNSRTFQIPACGGAIMLAQRTAEHLRFFEEDVEAVYFGDVSELREKLAYWLAPSRAKDRREMAAAGRARSLAEDYSYMPVVRRFLEHFGLPVAIDDGEQGGVVA